MVSVIIPAYNAEQYIERAVCSVLSQTWEKFELIVVNDGSVDATAELTAAMAKNDSRIRLISQNNGGVSRARNTGLENAVGKYITFLDADDELLPDALEKMRFCLETTGADMCAMSAVANDAAVTYRDAEMLVWSRKKAIEHLLEDHPATYTVWAKMYRRGSLGSVRFPVGKRVHEDSYFIFQCILSGMTMALWNYPIYRHHITQNSASRCGFSEKFFDMLDLAEEKMRQINERYPDYRDKAVNIGIKANMAMLQNLCKAKGRKYRNREKACIAYIKRNKQYFVPVTIHNKRWFWIITHNLYGAYKLCYQIKNRKKYD